ncbi:hypothetical protein BGZ50_008192 [Haplosporangium sp. Z 11]|nr:hypothetical protein BGZ50_008192 [Haplosporangium sp. Z 11]
MSEDVPAFLNACIAPTRNGSSVYLIGVPASAEGRLETYAVNITDINTPTAKYLGNSATSSVWSSQSPKACFDFPGNQAESESPTLVVQFGSDSYYTHTHPNGTITKSFYFPNTTFVSPKLFSLVGAVGPTNCPILTEYPKGDPLLSVGTFLAMLNAPDTLAYGYHIVFDNKGGGLIFTAVGSHTPINTTEGFLTLSNPQTVEMNGIALTNHSIAVTNNSDAYILDEVSNTTIMYKITPSVSSKLQLVSTSGDVPPFSPNMVATAMNSRIVVYGATNASAPSSTFHEFNSETGFWSGRGLVKPPSTVMPSPQPTQPPPSDGNVLIGAILGATIGGIVGGLAVVGLIALFFIRYRLKPTKPRTDNELPPASMSNDPRKSDIGTPPMQQNFALQQKPHEQQAYNSHYSYVPTYEDDVTNNTHASPAMSPMLTQQSEPVIFQSQQPYTYMPPTISAVTQQQQPTIFHPQTAISSSPIYSTASGMVSPQVAYTPATQVYTSPASARNPHQVTYIPATQIYTPPAEAHSPQYVNDSQEQDYVS